MTADRAAIRAEIKQLPVRLPVDDYNTLRNLAHFTGASMNAIVVRVLHDYLQGPREELFAALVEEGRDHYRDLLDRLAGE